MGVIIIIAFCHLNSDAHFARLLKQKIITQNYHRKSQRLPTQISCIYASNVKFLRFGGNKVSE